MIDKKHEDDINNYNYNKGDYSVQHRLGGRIKGQIYPADMGHLRKQN